MVLSLFDTSARQTRVFTPIDAQHVGMYVCGPTVYDRIHLGNARSLVVFDVLYRLLRVLYPQVTYVRNITDVDDKILARAAELGCSPRELVTETLGYFHEDVAALGCLAPTVEPRVTEHIAQIIALIERLLSQGYAYTVQGHVVFATQRYGAYGDFSRRTDSEILAGARVEVAPYKRNPRDFILWKPAVPQEAGALDLSWDSPWGRGRPGWHIECSAMSQAYLGEDYDLHGGGIDLIFPHHENEIAQSCCATGKGFARYWFHVGYLTSEGSKMSKSLGNFVTVRDALDRYGAGVCRYLLLQRFPTKPFELNAQAVAAAQRGEERLREAIARNPNQVSEVDHAVIAALCSGLNLPAALVALRTVARERPECLQATADVLGLFALDTAAPHSTEHVEVEAEAESEAVAQREEQIVALLRDRGTARAQKDFARADQLRDQLQCLGIQIEDTTVGVRWRDARRENTPENTHENTRGNTQWQSLTLS